MDNTKVGLFIKEQLKLNNITQEVLAEKLGISSSAVSQGLSGKNSFDISNLMEIAKILDMDLDLIVNAGKERETNLERLSQMTKDKFVKEDPKFKSLRELDSKGKQLIDYLVIHKNIEIIKFLQDRGINHMARGNTRYLALLIEFSELDILKKTVNHENILPNFYSKNRRGSRDSQLKAYVKTNHISEYDLLDRDDKAVVDAVINTKNTDILEYLPYFKEGMDKKNIPVMIYFAIQFDKVDIIKYEDEKHKPYDSQLRALILRKYEELFAYSIVHKSKNCLKFFYDKLVIMKYEKHFKLLTNTNDIEFSKWFIDTFPEKDRDRFHSNPKKGINNSESLIQLIKDNDMDMLKFSILFSNRESLDKALDSLKEEEIDFMKVLVKAGARFYSIDGYGKKVPQIQLSAFMKHLLEKIEK